MVLLRAMEMGYMILTQRDVSMMVRSWTATHRAMMVSDRMGHRLRITKWSQCRYHWMRQSAYNGQVMSDMLDAYTKL